MAVMQPLCGSGLSLTPRSHCGSCFSYALFFPRLLLHVVKSAAGCDWIGGFGCCRSQTGTGRPGGSAALVVINAMTRVWEEFRDAMEMEVLPNQGRESRVWIGSVKKLLSGEEEESPGVDEMLKALDVVGLSDTSGTGLTGQGSGLTGRGQD